MKTHSITRRVVTILLIAELVAAVVLSVAVFAHERRTRLRALDVGIRGRCDSLLGAVQDLEDAGDNVYVDPAELRLPAEDRWAVFNANGRVVGRSDNGVMLRVQAGDGVRDQQIDGVGYRLLQRHALRIIDRDETGGAGIRRPVVLVYASPKTHLVHEALESASYYILTTLLVSALTAALVAVFLRLSLRPVAELGAAAERLSLAHLQFTPPMSVEGIAELRPLAATLSSVVDKLRAAFVREQQFVGDAAHELKTSIAVVRSTIQVLMLKGRTPEEYHAGLQRALEDTQRMESLVQQMLSLARVEEVREANVTADLFAAAQLACLQLQPVSEHADVAVVFTGAPDARVRMSAERALVLVTNLLLNAIQHSRPQTQVTVTVTSLPHEVSLCVEDHGVGIDAAALPHIFERFYRADASRARETGGAGLGLAICRSIVEQAGGVLLVMSVPQRGTVVTATFSVA